MRNDLKYWKHMEEQLKNIGHICGENAENTWNTETWETMVEKVMFYYEL